MISSISALTDLSFSTTGSPDFLMILPVAGFTATCPFVLSTESNVTNKFSKLFASSYSINDLIQRTPTLVKSFDS